jgi:hypothetical protein
MTNRGDEIVRVTFEGSGRPAKTFAKGRVCSEPGCGTALSIYNKSRYCYLHQPLVTPRTRGRKHIA